MGKTWTEVRSQRPLNEECVDAHRRLMDHLRDRVLLDRYRSALQVIADAEPDSAARRLAREVLAAEMA